MTSIKKEDLAAAIAEGKSARAEKARADLASEFKALPSIGHKQIQQLANLGPEWPLFLQSLREGESPGLVRLLNHPHVREFRQIGVASLSGCATIVALTIFADLMGWLFQ